MPRVRSRAVSPAAEQLPSDFESLVRLHPPRAIHDEAEYANTQEVIDRLTSLVSPSEGQLAYLETLSILFEAYEEEHHALDPAAAGPAEMLRFLMDQRSETVEDVERAMGIPAAGNFLSGRAEPSASDVRALADHFHVRADLFL